MTTPNPELQTVTRSDGMVVPVDALVQLRTVALMSGLTEVTDERLLQEVRIVDTARLPSNHPASYPRLREPQGGWPGAILARFNFEWQIFNELRAKQCPNCRAQRDDPDGGKLYAPVGKPISKGFSDFLNYGLVGFACPVCGQKAFGQHLLATCGVADRAILLKPDDYWWWGEEGREIFDKMIRLIFTSFVQSAAHINEWWTFVSPLGDGKTSALQFLAVKLAQSGIKARYISAGDFEDRVEDAMKMGDWGRPPIVDALASVPVLLFDQPDWLKQGTYENPHPVAKWFRDLMEERNRMRAYMATVLAINTKFEENKGGAVLAPVMDRIYAGRIARCNGLGIRKSLGDDGLNKTLDEEGGSDGENSIQP